MTSKISFFNLGKENVKHRAGMVLITLLGFFGCILSFLISVQGIFSSNEEASEILKGITELSKPESVMGMFCGAAAIILAVSGFRYLHSKTEIDFYHSLPVKRIDILRTVFISDMVVFTIPLLITEILRCLIIMVTGCFSLAFLTNTVLSFFCYIAVFVLVYLTMVLAMIMTGHTFVALLGFCVFAGYFPLLIQQMFPSMAGIFFRTYCEEPKILNIFSWLSPIAVGRNLISGPASAEWGYYGKYFVAAILWIAVLSFLNVILFRKRVSEAAGKAMAFPKTKSVIRIMMVIPLAIYGGVFLYQVSFSAFKPWFIVGVFIGGFLVHGVMECIYQFDVKGLLSHKKQMILSVGAAFLIVGFFWLDISGYDAYVPEAKEAESVLIDAPMTAVTEGIYWGKERSGISGKDMEQVLDILQKVTAENEKNHEAYYYGKYEEWGEETYDLYTVEYRLKNNQAKKRSYVLGKELQDELLTCLYDTENYRKDTYPLYTADWSRVESVAINYPVDNEEIKMTKEQRAELFQIYLEEFSKMDYKDLKTQIPFGRLLITFRKESDSSNEVVYGGNNYEKYIEAYVDSYYLYPSFEKTIAYLRDELEVELETSMEKTEISKIEVYDYDEKEGDQTYVITDGKVIDSVKDRLVYFSDDDIVNLYSLDGLTVTATLETAAGKEERILYTDKQTEETLKNDKYKK